VNSFEYVVVGGGAAGCVLASRLSSDPALRVLLIEAGPDMLPGEEPASVRDSFPRDSGDPAVTWDGLEVEIGADPGDGQPVSRRRFSQGRLIGGSSSINGMMAQRGLPADYDEWAALGATGWSWKDVLPYFKRLEDDLDFSDALHGTGGPIPIRRAPRSTWPAFSRAVAEAFESDGYAFVPDLNASEGDCVTAVPLHNIATQRVSAAMAYLSPDVRARPNLTIIANAVVERLIIVDGAVLGVSACSTAGMTRFDGREIVVCCGAIQSPALLLRSGIGPAAHLQALDIPVVANRPGVGRNLANHAGLYISVHLPRRSRHDRSRTDCWATAMLRYSSGHPGCAAGDMQIVPASRTAWHPLGWSLGALAVFLYKPFSRGSVELASADPPTPPIVKSKILSDPRDVARMEEGVAIAARALATMGVRNVIHEAFMAPGGRANALNRPGLMNWMKSGLASSLFDLSSALRRTMLGPYRVDLGKLTSDRTARAALVRNHTSGAHHVCGTCRIGRADDPEAVVDASCRVYGVQGLRVVDASVMPSIVSANTFLPVVMIGEKVAQEILDARRSVRGLA
jgi:5-(hydroxymethyl)furfural/furfural oxidase